MHLVAPCVALVRWPLLTPSARCILAQDARYESGLDNSPMYDSPPVEYNKSRHHMLLYDVGMSSMYVMETQLLAEIASRKGLANDVKMLQQRQQAVASVRTNCVLRVRVCACTCVRVCCVCF